MAQHASYLLQGINLAVTKHHIWENYKCHNLHIGTAVAQLVD